MKPPVSRRERCGVYEITSTLFPHMRKVFITVGLVWLTVIGMGASFDSAQDKQQAPPPWAYTVNPPPTPGATPAPVDPAPKQVPGTHGDVDDRADA